MVDDDKKTAEILRQKLVKVINNNDPEIREKNILAQGKRLRMYINSIDTLNITLE